MFETAYYKKFIKPGQTLRSPNESVVFKAIKPGRFMYLEEIKSAVLADKENDSVKSGTAVCDVLGWLITNNFVGEIHGLKIEKFLKTL